MMLRPATDQDLEQMRRWRNLPVNRQVSMHQHEIAPEEHRAWWQQVRTDPHREVLVFEYDGTGLGVVSFADLEVEVGERSGSWGFYLDHPRLEAMGATILAWNRVMKEAIDYAFGQLRLDVLHAEVLESNHAVRSTNRRFGFVEGSPRTSYVEGRQSTVLPVSLRRVDRRATRRPTDVQGEARPGR